MSSNIGKKILCWNKMPMNLDNETAVRNYKGVVLGNQQLIGIKVYFHRKQIMAVDVHVYPDIMKATNIEF